MKQAGILLTLISVMVFVLAGVAMAALINGNNANNNLVGTPRADVIRGNDNMRARGGDDELMGGPGRDYIHAVDKVEDDINCGRGRDVAEANPADDSRAVVRGSSGQAGTSARARIGVGIKVTS